MPRLSPFRLYDAIELLSLLILLFSLLLPLFSFSHDYFAIIDITLIISLLPFHAIDIIHAIDISLLILRFIFDAS
jgi:hypothetical protein